MVAYQVGYSAVTQCNDSIDTLPAGYTLFGNTTSNSIVVTGLEPHTCYVFGVRVHSEELEKWSIVVLRTLTGEIYDYIVTLLLILIFRRS